MAGFLLDTCVFSEFTKRDPAPSVVSFLTDPGKFWISSVARYELGLGVNLLPQSDRRDALKIQISFLMDLFENRALPVGNKEMDAAAFLMAKAKDSAQAPEFVDALIAGTAMANGLVLVTRKVKDFEALEIDLANPWEER